MRAILGSVAAVLLSSSVTAFGQANIQPAPNILKAQPEPALAPVALPRVPAALESPTDQPIVDLTIRLLEVRGNVKLPGEKPATTTNPDADRLAKSNEPKASRPTSAAATGSRILSDDEVKAFITTLQSDARSNILCAPRMRLELGTKGELRSGGEIVVGKETANNEKDETPTPLKTLFFGTAMQTTVTQPNPGLLRIALQLEHSGLTKNTNGVPGVNTRRIQTTVELKENQTVMLSGLKSTRDAVTVTRLPVLGDLPVIGDSLFSRTKTDTEETELVVLITPTLLGATE